MLIFLNPIFLAELIFLIISFFVWFLFKNCKYLSLKVWIPILSLLTPFLYNNSNFSSVIFSILHSKVNSIFFDLLNIFIILNNLFNCSMFRQLGVPPPIYIVSNFSCYRKVAHQAMFL